MTPIEHLDAVRWSTPDSYAGFSPVGDYLIMAQNRDSDALTRSNWITLCADLGAEAYDDGDENFADRPTVYQWRASHWGVGWVEYLMVRADAADDVLTKAGEWLCALADYPVADEEHFSNLEFDEVCEYWESMSVADRVDVLRRSRSSASIFAARRDELPDDAGHIFEYLR